MFCIQNIENFVENILSYRKVEIHGRKLFLWSEIKKIEIYKF